MVIAVLLTGIQYAHAGMDPPNPFIGLNKFMILVPTSIVFYFETRYDPR